MAIPTTEAVPLVDLRAQYRACKPEIDEAVARVLESGRYVLGSEVEAFERSFARYCGVAHAIGVGSGTAALRLALMSFGIGAGDEVITTPLTFVATSAAILHAGARPVFVDVDPRTCNLDPACVEAAITERTRAILPVHLHGQPVDMAPICAIAAARGLRIIEDACQAVGATYEGTRVGGLGDAGCFSFYPAKNLGAAGDGGMVTTNDEEVAARLRALRDHGRVGHYRHESVGVTSRLDAIQAAILGVKLPYLDTWNAARRQHAATYSRLLEDLDVVLPNEIAPCRSVYHLYVGRIAGRDAVLDRLSAEGIGAGIHYPVPVHLQPAYAPLGKSRGSIPVAESCADSVLSLPLFPEMTSRQTEAVVHALELALE